MKKVIITMILSALSVGLVFVGLFFYAKWRGLKPALLPPPADIADIIKDQADKTGEVTTDNSVGFPLNLPNGFEISIFARDLPAARALAIDGQGNMWVSQTRENQISLLEVEQGEVVAQYPVFKNLNRPHGLAFDPQNPYLLYIAEEDKISRVSVYSDGGLEKLVDLNGGGRHFTRTIAFGPDDRLYASIGSSCDVCAEKNEQRAKIFSMKRDGTDFKEYARGLRNTVFFTWSYIDGRMWGTDMGRDLLGDHLPPDEINIIEAGGNYGWPICYGQNIHDTVYDKNTYIRNPCQEPFEKKSVIDLPAHVAPLGLAFVPEEGWPEAYWYDLLVAYHGSWNSSVPVGYKIARLKLDDKGNFLGAEDFISGWLTENNEALGRPVQIITQPGGIMYVSDDKAGVIYKIVYNGVSYREDIGKKLEKTDLIRLDQPRPNQKIESPLLLTGVARGNWFFEANFPIYLYDDNGNNLGFAIATAKSDWMTTEFVPFEARLDFEEPTTRTGKLILRKDNPSGLPQYDDELYLPIRF